MESAADLVEVVGRTHTPLHVVVPEDVVCVLELGGVADGLPLVLLGAVDDVILVPEDVSVALRRLEAQIVMTGVPVLAEAAHGGRS